jgi:hypothetical protein
MNTSIQDVMHPEDAELVRYLDEELPEERAVILMNHFASCADCMVRREELEDVSSWLSGGLTLLDEEVPVDEIARARALAAVRAAARSDAKVGAPIGWVRAAAAIAVLVVGAAVAPPVRAWIADLVAPRIASEAIAPAPVAEAAGAEVGATISFTPAVGVFRVELATLQAGGAVSLHATTGEQAAALVVGGADVSLLVLPSGLRIENHPASTATYRLELPAGLVDRVEFFAGSSLIAGHDLRADAPVTLVPLAPELTPR